MSFNEKLIELRKKEGLSQEELGYKLNVTRQTISKWELGQTTPEMEKLSEISKIFNISVDELISNQDSTLNQASVISEPDLGTKSVKNNKRLFIIIVILTIIAIVLAVFAISKSTTDKQNSMQEERLVDKFYGLFDKFFVLFDKTVDSQDNILEDSSEMSKKFDVSSFNGKFEIHDGSTVGASLKHLLDEIITNNKTNDRLITVKYNDIVTQDATEIQNLKLSIKDLSGFDVTYEYDEEGYISTAIIQKVITQFEIRSFNNPFEMYSGSNIGTNIHIVLDKIITNNKTKDRKISVTYLGKETLVENEIISIKNQTNTFANFDLIYEYDQDGFIYKAIIQNY